MKELLYFLGGLFIGGNIGFVISVFCVAAKKSDKQIGIK